MAALWWCCAAGAQGLTLLPDAGGADRFKCLTRVEGARPAVDYPEPQRFNGVGGTVRVRLEFFERDKGPRTDVLSSPSRALADAVLSYVDDYRLPCHEEGSAPDVAIQEFAFDPRDGRKVTWVKLQPVPADSDGCKMVGVEKTQLKHYPAAFVRDRRAGLGLLDRGDHREGKVLALATFEKPGIAPEITILHSGGDPALDAAVVEAMEQIRMECSGTGPPRQRLAIQMFWFQIEGRARTVLKDLDLKQFLGAMDQIESHKVRFDLSSMGCPFEVQLELYQPFARNLVGEVGSVDPNRRGFLAWLQSVALRLPPKVLDQVLGSSMRISVPCGLLDLTS